MIDISNQYKVKEFETIAAIEMHLHEIQKEIVNYRNRKHSGLSSVISNLHNIEEHARRISDLAHGKA